MKNNNPKMYLRFFLTLALSIILASCSTVDLTFRGEESPAIGTVSEENLETIILDASLTAADLLPMNQGPASEAPAAEAPPFSYYWDSIEFNSYLQNNWESFTVKEVKVKVGDKVHTGDVIATIQEPDELIDQWLADTDFWDDTSLKLITREEYLANHEDIYISSAKAGLAYFQEQFDDANEYYDSISLPRASQEELTALQTEMDATDLEMRKIISTNDVYKHCYSYGYYDNSPFDIYSYYDDCYFNIYNTSDAKNFSAAYDRKQELVGEFNYLSATFTDEQILVARIRKNNAKAELDKAQKVYDSIMAGDYGLNFYSGYYWDNYSGSDTFKWGITENGIFDEYDMMEALRSRFIITAPFDGVILSVNLRSGDEIDSSGLGNAFQMVDPDDTRLIAKIPERYVGIIDTQLPVVVFRQDSNVKYSGETISISPIGTKNTASVVVSGSTQQSGVMLVNNTQVTFDMAIKFDLPEDLPFIGATYQVEIPLTSPVTFLSIPENGLRRDGKNYFVIVTGTGEDFKVPVNVISTQNNTVLVKPVYKDALLAGDQILLNNE